MRNSKFGKSRLIPFGPRLAGRLAPTRRFVSSGSGPPPRGAVLLLERPTAVATNSIRNALRDELLPRLHLTIPPGTRAPCVHGLRHTFAVRTLLRWYRDGVDPHARLHHLATFLGHVNPQSTAVYLTITSELLRAANERYEAFAAPRPRGAAMSAVTVGHLVHDFFVDYLAQQKGLRQSSVRSYRDTLRLFLPFAANNARQPISRLRSRTSPSSACSRS